VRTLDIDEPRARNAEHTVFAVCVTFSEASTRPPATSTSKTCYSSSLFQPCLAWSSGPHCRHTTKKRVETRSQVQWHGRFDSVPGKSCILARSIPTTFATTLRDCCWSVSLHLGPSLGSCRCYTVFASQHMKYRRQRTWLRGFNTMVACRQPAADIHLISNRRRRETYIRQQ
jgi:hypothetical protein